MLRFAARNWAVWCVVSACACTGQTRQPGPGASELAKGPAPTASALPVSVASPVSVTSARPGGPSTPPPDLERRFQAHLAEQRDLEFSGLERELSLARKPDRRLSFDPESARYAALVQAKLALSPEERAAFKRDGVVNVDHQQRYSMAAAYFAVFTRDLPVLITTDSVLHALHRSYDAILMELEMSELTATLSATLEKSHEALRRAKLTTPKLQASAGDVDLYLTVARNLLTEKNAAATWNDALPVPSLFGNDDRVRLSLDKIASLQFQESELYGGRRSIDYSQFKARGHYTKLPELSRYFRAMIWLGRADTGFVLAPPDKNSGLQADAERELRSAALLASVVEQSGELGRFEAMGHTVDFLVGSSDNLTIKQLLKALREAGVRDPSALEQTGSVVALQQKLALAGRQQIRSQVLTPPQNAEQAAVPPSLFQLFGQRFLLDSFALSRLVYDSIWFKGEKVERVMPTGLDVMAALGSDEATRLLRPELESFHYSSNLLAVRRTIDDLAPAELEQNVASLWLDSLRKLDDVPAQGHFPEVMRRTPFLRKQLQTQLASWAELRHDTVLYAKQSYTAGILCEYPEGYVEPYPEFFARLALLTERAGQRLAALNTNTNGSGYAKFLANFSTTMKYLEVLARKELEAKPFTVPERAYLKKTIDERGGGCGGPSYDGWYARLFYGGSPEHWEPTVTDVHTDPTSERVLQEGVGDANFIVLAVDNQKDRAVYVGPVYSYYEFTHEASDRLTDEQWQALIERQALPARPAWWTSAFPAKAQQRTLSLSDEPPWAPDPRQLALQKLWKRASLAKGAERQRLLDQARVLAEVTNAPPFPPEDAKP